MPELISCVNERVELRCGDLLFTGTTARVGREDGRFLQPGVLAETEIEGIGLLRKYRGRASDLRLPFLPAQVGQVTR